MSTRGLSCVVVIGVMIQGETKKGIQMVEDERLISYPDSLCTQRTANQPDQSCAAANFNDSPTFHKIWTQCSKVLGQNLDIEYR